MDECMQIEWEYKCKALRGDHAFLHKVWLGGHCPAHLLLQISLVLPSMEWMEIMPVCLRVRQVWRPVLLAHYITGPVCPFSEGPVPSGDVCFPCSFGVSEGISVCGFVSSFPTVPQAPWHSVCVLRRLGGRGGVGEWELVV